MPFHKTAPPVTVLMPSYNAEKYVGEAMESILTQSHVNLEFLIIDDGSTDNTLAVIRSFTDPRIRLMVHEKNMGLTYTLNEGIALSSHELIARMDADDISHPWRLEKQVDHMMTYPGCVMVSSWVKIMDQGGHFIRTEGVFSRHVYYSLTFECCIYHPTVLYRKREVQDVGGYHLEYAEDFDLFCRLSRAFRIDTLEEPLLWYRVHDQNTNTVTRKTEYEAFSRRVLENNFSYLLGGDVPVPPDYAACYRYDFEPLLQKQSLAEIRRCLALLDTLSSRILRTENPNRDQEAILFIGGYKKNYIIKSMAAAMNLWPMIRLLVHYRCYAFTLLLILKKTKNRFARMKKNGSYVKTPENGMIHEYV